MRNRAVIRQHADDINPNLDPYLLGHYRSPTIHIWSGEDHTEFLIRSDKLLDGILPPGWRDMPDSLDIDGLESHISVLNHFLARRHQCFYKEVTRPRDRDLLRTFKLVHVMS